jgi:hypothetical protein
MNDATSLTPTFAGFLLNRKIIGITGPERQANLTTKQR